MRKMGLVSYRGDRLKQVKFLLGGIGTGSISLEGRGSLTDWEMFNRPSKGKNLYGNFVSIIIRQKEPVIKIVARKPFPPYESPHGFKNIRMEGFPHFMDTEFTNFFPFAILDFIERFPFKDNSSCL